MVKKIKKRTIAIIGVIVAAIIAFLGKMFFVANSPNTVCLYGVVTPNYMDYTQFNNKFTAYIGKNSLPHVKALVNVVLANNATSYKIVSINNITTNEELIEMVSNLEAQEYNISAEFDDEGVITNIVITEIEDIES